MKGIEGIGRIKVSQSAQRKKELHKDKINTVFLVNPLSTFVIPFFLNYFIIIALKSFRSSLICFSNTALLPKSIYIVIFTSLPFLNMFNNI